MTGKLNTLIVAIVLVGLFASILLTNAPASQAGPTAVAMPPQQIDVVARPQQHQPISYSGPHVESVREQLDPHASDRYLVWTERERSLKPEVNDLFDSSDIMGLDIQTGKPIAVSNAPGAQSEPAISGSMAVWQQTAADCVICDREIMAKDLTTDKVFAVAANTSTRNSNDQAHPTVSGNYVAWLEMDDTSIAVVLKSLSSGKLSKVRSAGINSKVSFDRPVLSDQYLVWAEATVGQSAGGSLAKQLYAYKLSDGKSIGLVAQGDASTQYAVDGHNLVWTDAQLHLRNLETSNSLVVAQGEIKSPFVSSNTLVWSEINPATGVFDLWGTGLNTLKPVPLVSDVKSELGATVVGDRLIWQSDGSVSKGGGLVASTSLSNAFATAPSRQAALDAQARQRSQRESASVTGEPTTLAGYHVYKGIFGPNGSWGSGHAVVDALGASNPNNQNPYFGSILLLSGQLNNPTHADFQGATPGSNDPAWGPAAKNVALLFQANKGKVIVRLQPGFDHGFFPVQVPVSLPTEEEADLLSKANAPGPTELANAIATFLNQKDSQTQFVNGWIANFIVGNEPNNGGDGWLSKLQHCHHCAWCGAKRFYNWDGQSDIQLYVAISAYYKQLWESMPSDIKARINDHSLTLWSPPMDPNGPTYMYDYMTAMINTYQNVSYNVYPHPARNGDPQGVDTLSPIPGASYGHLRNRTFDISFGPTLKSRMDVSGDLKSQIVEFGWEPGAMGICNSYFTPTPNGFQFNGQDSTWPTPVNYPTPDNCKSTDGLPHRFEQDLDYFLRSSQRHNAESVTVWIIYGSGGPYADGVNQQGTPTNWFTYYQQSNP